ncbi:MAG TPA: 2-amino-4-hydroxy-6-hydroxymethyldihydropteridine diphosphokinase, partial [Clostridiales bacterium]|nr:2-amino-4-hydroxy-6-hydroxymethyldihydropteridine diphosphokinase [Clostridiales bacterium]
MVTSYLSLGSNMGDRLRNLTDAVKMLDDTKGIDVSKVSSIYETEPIGYKDQDDFLNICVKVRTDLAPGELLDRCHEIENELKRVRRIRNGPRTIDLDILEYGDVKSDDPVLI